MVLRKHTINISFYLTYKIKFTHQIIIDITAFVYCRYLDVFALPLA